MENVPTARCFSFHFLFETVSPNCEHLSAISPFILFSSGVSVCPSSSCLIFLETNYRVLHEQQERKKKRKKYKGDQFWQRASCFLNFMSTSLFSQDFLFSLKTSLLYCIFVCVHFMFVFLLWVLLLSYH